MIGNKFSGNEIAMEFLQLMKKASESKEEIKKEASANPADFLVAADESEAKDPLDAPIDAMDAVSCAVDEVNEVADATVVDEADDKEVKIEADNVEVETDGDVDVSEEGDANDFMALPVSHAGKYILQGLGKVAGALRLKDENFMADMVEVTARSIQNDLVKEASRKASSLDNLEKVAAKFKASGDQYSADLLKVAIDQIKAKNE